MARLGKIYQNENISFNYSDIWKEQDPKTRGPSCVKALVKVVNKIPSIITIYNYPEKTDKSTTELLKELNNSFTNQGWDIIHSDIGSIDGVNSIEIVANAKMDDRMLQLHTTFIFHKESMYVFELTSCPESTEEIDDYNRIINTIVFLQ
jgi:hypothetical protein